MQAGGMINLRSSGTSAGSFAGERNGASRPSRLAFNFDEDTDTMQMCVFEAAGRTFGVDIRHIREITFPRASAPIPHAPESVIGFINLRGQIHLVLCLRKVLGLAEAEPERRQRLIIFTAATGEAFGLRVDAVRDIVMLSATEIKKHGLAVSAPSAGEMSTGSEAAASGLIIGAAPYGQHYVEMVDPCRLLAPVEADIRAIKTTAPMKGKQE